MKIKQEKRIVAIVGRPNVGKSAIFNRLAKRRIAIVHAQSGVTRDRLIHEVSWEDNRFILIDTGGICKEAKNSNGSNNIETDILNQVDVAINDASVILFIVDIETGLLPLDHDVADLLRAKDCTTFLLANKADTHEKDILSSDFEQLGFPSFPVSALHNRGFSEPMEEVIKSLPGTDNATTSHPLKVAIIGKPNVGKSSYINRVLKNDRVIVSDIPGTTRDSIDIPFIVGEGEQARHYIFIDTAGMRRVGKINSSVERFSRFRAEKSINTSDVVVLVLDALTGPTEQDKKIAALAIKCGKGCVVIVNKWDLQKVTERKYGPEVFHTMPFLAHCPLIFVSAKTGYNIRRSIDAIDHVGSQVSAVLPTGILNRTLLNAYERVRPPTIKGKPLKIFYATQVGTRPIKIRVFVNNPSRVKSAYTEYLINRLRAGFGLEGSPVLLQFRPRRSK